MNIGSMYTNISIVAYPVFGVCTTAVQWERMQTVAEELSIESGLHLF